MQVPQTVKSVSSSRNNFNRTTPYMKMESTERSIRIQIAAMGGDSESMSKFRMGYLRCEVGLMAYGPESYLGEHQFCCLFLFLVSPQQPRICAANKLDQLPTSFRP
ncbi:hypothetical protein LINPERPRIM_LOCUS11883 [Linum perenne]